MAAEFIIIDTTKRLGAELRGAVELVRSAADKLKKCKEVMDKTVDLAPTPDDYTLLESQFGIASGQGQTVYNLTAGAHAALSVSDVVQILARMG